MFKPSFILLIAPVLFQLLNVRMSDMKKVCWRGEVTVLLTLAPSVSLNKIKYSSLCFTNLHGKYYSSKSTGKHVAVKHVSIHCHFVSYNIKIKQKTCFIRHRQAS